MNPKLNGKKSDVQWNPLNWSVGIIDRYWAIFNLEKIVEDRVTIPAYQDLLEEWENEVEQREVQT